LYVCGCPDKVAKSLSKEGDHFNIEIVAVYERGAAHLSKTDAATT
jgi:hypothetical protein